MKRVIAINGGPRKNRNTVKLLRSALDGAESTGADTEWINLYDIDYKGCVSCFSCKTVENYRNGRCLLNDELSPVLVRVMNSDVLLIGSPIYFHDVTGVLRSFLERLLFMNLAYEKDNISVMEKKISCGVIYTMNVSEEMMLEFGYTHIFDLQMKSLKILRGEVSFITSCDTLQFDDYSRYHAPKYDVKQKKTHHETHFPEDLEKAFLLGKKLANG
jgi:multimeric flavodoxin WrbA